MEVVRALLGKGANPNVNAMGLTPFLVAAGVGAGNRGGTGLAAQASAGGPANLALMDQLVEHGANVNAQVTGTKTYSMRIARAPSSNEGWTAGRVDLVKYLLDKGANPDILDSNGKKAIDLVGTRPAVTPPPTAGGRRTAAAEDNAAAITAEIRGLLQK